jgi:cysteine-S-conjugate beta-lyase
VAGEDIYGGSDRLLSQVVPRSGVVVKLVWSRSGPTCVLYNIFTVNHKCNMYLFFCARRVDTSNIAEVASAVGPKTRLVWLESPTNPRQQITDIRVITIFCSGLLAV